MSSDLAGHDALLYVIYVRQAKVLCGSNVAQEVGSAGSSDSSSDSRGDMVVAGEYIRYKRPKDVEGRIVADPLLEGHVGGDLVHGHVSGALHHYLDVALPGTLCKVAQLDQLRDLAGVSCVIDTAGTESVTKADRHVVLVEYVKDLIVELEEGIFVACHHHPRKKQRASTGNDVHFSSLSHEGLHCTAVDTGVDRHEVNALLSVSTDHLQEVLCGDLQQVLLQIADSVVHGDSADHCRRALDQLRAEGVGLAVIAQVHDSLSAEFVGKLHLLHLHIVVFSVA